MNTPAPAGGSVFVSYRRRDTSAYARLLHGELTRRLGDGQVFMDVDSIDIGVDFGEAVDRAVRSCTVLLAVIGTGWLGATDEQGRRRLDDPDDIVRLEVEAALARGIRLIPVLVEGAAMPRRHELPGSLVPLARRNALELTHSRYHHDVAQLITAVEKAVGAPSPAAGTSAASDRPAGSGDPPVAHRRSARALRASAVGAEALAAAEALTDPPTRVFALVELVTDLVAAGEPALAGDAADAALATASGAPDNEQLIWFAAEALARAGRYPEAVRAAMSDDTGYYRWSALAAIARRSAERGGVERAFAAARMIPDSDDKVLALAGLAEVFGREDRRDLASAAAGEARRTAETTRGSFGEEPAFASLARTLAWAGDIAGALEAATVPRHGGLRSNALSAIAAVYARNGDIRKAIDLSTGIPEHEWRAQTLRDLGALLAERGDVHTAEEVARRLLEVAAAEDVRARERDDALGWAAGLFARTGDPATALEVAADVVDAARRSSALVAVAQGQAAAGDAQRALATCRDIAPDRHRADALIAVADVLADRHEPDRSADLLAEAHALTGRIPAEAKPSVLGAIARVLGSRRS